MILTSLVSVAILGTGFFASQPTFVRASEEAAEKASAEADAQKEFLANYDEALEVTVKELEKADTKNNPELEAQKQKTIEALKVASAETRAKIVEGFKNGLTAKQAENIIDEANKKASEEAAEKASAEADAQKEFLANYDEALEVTVKELEKADTKNNPELEAQKQKTIEALKVASAETRAKIVEGFKNGLTAKQAENIIDEANKKASEEAAEKPKPAQPSTPKPGWKQENGMWYFYNTDGAMATGWAKVNGSWYYLNRNGAMATGWAKVNGSWYYLNRNGAMATGWAKVNGSWYYLNRNGAMATGWAKVNGSWYYLNRNGAMATGWVKDGDTRYYLEASGAMKASQWFKVLDKWYYVNGSGALAVNTTVDGYRESMLMVNGFKPIKLNHVKNI
ncbi:choline binding protein Cbp2 [Streptococcus pneumoniae]|nr:choline binding protein Cbp2 [Streptococcus pneumoniae]